jgi:hypothetical protein
MKSILPEKLYPHIPGNIFLIGGPTPLRGISLLFGFQR